MINRREMMVSAGVILSGASLLPLMVSRAFATSKIELGTASVQVVSDGHLKLPGSFVFNGMPEGELKTIIADYKVSMDGIEPDCNLTIYRDGERTVIFDVGAGPNFMPSAGKLSEALEAAESSPDDVTHVVFTHAHPDHLWGLLDEFDEPFFPEAEYRIAKAEWDYWLDPKTVETIGEARQAFAAGAKRNLKAIEDKIDFFEPDEEVLPGVLARATHGHTPGHTSFELRSGSESLMIIGDAIGNHHVAFEKPDWETNSDQDKTMGARTRVGLLDQLATQKTKFVGFHLPYPGIGYAEEKGGAYRFVRA